MSICIVEDFTLFAFRIVHAFGVNSLLQNCQMANCVWPRRSIDEVSNKTLLSAHDHRVW